jgi:uncharacterized protein (DUF885 family)
MRRLLVSSAAVLALMAGVSAAAAQDPHAGHAGHAAPAAATQSEDARLAAFFEQAFQERIALSPQQMTSLGLKTDYDKLDDNTDAAAARSLALAERQLLQLNDQFNPQNLGEDSRLSWRLFEYGVEQARLSNRWRDRGYQFAANGNPTTGLPVFMINNHRVTSVSDAEAYVARLIEAEREKRLTTIDKDAAVALITAAFPTITEALASQMVNGTNDITPGGPNGGT